MRAVRAPNLAYTPNAFGTVRALGINQYPGEMAIVRELVQNADDAFDRDANIFPSYIKFVIEDEELVIEHDGKPFSRPPQHLLEKSPLTDAEDKELAGYDFYRICKIGLGKTDERMTGKFGTGFTASFHITDTPRIESNGWDFEIHIAKEPTIREIRSSRLTLIHLPYRSTTTPSSMKIGAEIFDIDKLRRFEEQILVECYKIIFFLKHIKTIKVVKGKDILYVVKKTERKMKSGVKNLVYMNVTISVQNFQDKNWIDPKEKWLFYSLENISIPSQFKALRLKMKQKVAIALPAARSTFGEKYKVPNYSYFTFPVKETGFHFKYNASRLFTTTGRTEFISKEGLPNAWNKWQIDNVVLLFTKIVSHFIRMKRSPEFLYGLLPHPHGYSHEYDKYLIDRLRERILTHNITVFNTTKGKWVGPKGTYLGDKRLEQILPKSEYRHFMDVTLMKKHKDVIGFYGATILSPKDLIDYLEKKQKTEQFESRFGRNPKRGQAHKLRLALEYLASSGLDPTETERLRHINFILTEDNTLRSADYRVYFPTDQSMPLINPDDIVHRSMYSSVESRLFLERRLKITRIGLHDLITDSFLRRLKDYTDKQKFEFVLYIVKRRKEVTRNKETLNRLASQLKGFLKLEINSSEDTEIFFDSRELRHIFHTKLNYLSAEYEHALAKNSQRWRLFFRSIGVREIPARSKIVVIAFDIAGQGFSQDNALRAERLFRFIGKNFKKISTANKWDFRELSVIQWMPTTNNHLDYPNRIYVDKKLSCLVGYRPSFLSFHVTKGNPLVESLNMHVRPVIADVVNHLMDHRAISSTDRDKKVDPRIYEYLNQNANLIGSDQADKLRNNRIIWFAGKLWHPRKSFSKDHRGEFGPNGEIRAYIHRVRLKDLTELCSLLGVESEPKVPGDYVDFLVDVSELAGKIDITKWKKYLWNAHEKIAQSEYPLSEDQKIRLASKKVIVHDSNLMLPNECYLVRKSDKMYIDRIQRSGISDVAFVLENDPKRERFYLSIGMNEVYDSILQRREDDNPAEACLKWKSNLEHLIPWLNGYAYHQFGEEGLPKLDKLESIEVEQVSGLKVVYGVDYKGNTIEGNPIEDFCCVAPDQDGKSILYLDKSFDETNNEQVSFLSELLATLISSRGDINRINWVVLMMQYFRFGEISGISAYYPGKEEIKKEPGTPPVEPADMETEPEDKPEKPMPKDKPTPRDDGLNEPSLPIPKPLPKKRKLGAPLSRGGGTPTPHALNYDMERAWVRNQANSFCQVCILFCEKCKLKDSKGQCDCETRKNSEKALVHHHLEPFERDFRRDIRGNLVVLCGYHHMQLDGTNLRAGYLKEKVSIIKRKHDVLLRIWPKNKEEEEIRLRFTKDHFREFENYAYSEV